MRNQIRKKEFIVEQVWTESMFVLSLLDLTLFDAVVVDHYVRMK